MTMTATQVNNLRRQIRQRDKLLAIATSRNEELEAENNLLKTALKSIMENGNHALEIRLNALPRENSVCCQLSVYSQGVRHEQTCKHHHDLAVH